MLGPKGLYPFRNQHILRRGGVIVRAYLAVDDGNDPSARNDLHHCGSRADQQTDSRVQTPFADHALLSRGRASSRSKTEAPRGLLPPLARSAIKEIF
jgi:hypothetical protein